MNNNDEKQMDWPALAREAHYQVGSFLALLGIGERKLEREFNSFFGIPPSKYLRALQINAAVDLLLKGLQPKAFIADLYFASMSQFMREFKRYTGFTPRKFFLRVSARKKSGT